MAKYLIVVALLFPSLGFAQSVFINEIAWMGTSTSANDEWIELFNPTQAEIGLSDWRIEAEAGSPSLSLPGNISANGYVVLERTNDESAPGIQALVVYSGALENGGEKLSLLDSHGNVVDGVDGSQGWPAGDSTTRQTMELSQGSWITSLNAEGSPGMKNSELLQKQNIPLTGYEGYMVGVPFLPSHFAIALVLAVLCSLLILILKKVIDRRASNSFDAPGD